MAQTLKSCLQPSEMFLGYCWVCWSWCQRSFHLCEPGFHPSLRLFPLLVQFGICVALIFRQVDERERFSPVSPYER